MTDTLEEQEQQLLDEMNESDSYKGYEVTYPYQVKFSFEDDDHNTEVVIKTKSVEYFFGENETDILRQKKIADRFSKKLLSKYILKWIGDRLWTVEPDNCVLTYTGTPETRELTEEELHETEREYITV